MVLNSDPSASNARVLVLDDWATESKRDRRRQVTHPASPIVGDAAILGVLGLTAGPGVSLPILGEGMWAAQRYGEQQDPCTNAQLLLHTTFLLSRGLCRKFCVEV